MHVCRVGPRPAILRPITRRLPLLTNHSQRNSGPSLNRSVRCNGGKRRPGGEFQHTSSTKPRNHTAPRHPLLSIRRSFNLRHLDDLSTNSARLAARRTIRARDPESKTREEQIHTTTVKMLQSSRSAAVMALRGMCGIPGDSCISIGLNPRC